MVAMALSLGVSLQAGLASEAKAQQNQGGSASEDLVGTQGRAIALPTMTVTARRIEEDPKDIPFSVTVLDGKEIEQKGNYSLEEVLRSTPGVSVNTSGGANVSSISIRGVGALYPLSMDDASVVVNLDGSPVNPRNLSLGILDLEQVEVLKGPQGTLFGGLGGAGAINLTTRKPTRHVEGYVQGEYGEDHQHRMAAAVGGPLSEQFSGRLAVQQSAYDYPITNRQTGEPLSEPDFLGVRGSLLWDIQPETSALFSVEYDHSRHMGENIVLKPYGDDPEIDLTPGVYDYSKKNMKRYSLEVNHEFENSQITSVTSYSDTYNISPVFFDRMVYQSMMGVPSEYWRDQEVSENVFTQDLRVSSLPGANLFWVAGASALYSERGYDHPRVGGASGIVYPGTSQYRDFTTQRYGVYGEVTVPVIEDLKVTAGVRHTLDLKTYDATYTARGVSVQDSGDLSDNFTTGRLGVSYAVTPEANIYATFSRGYNPGGYQDYAETAGDAEYKAGSIYSGEVGMKSEFLNKRLRLDASAFVTKVQDNYMIDSKGVSSFVLNADTRSVGGELAASWRVADALTLEGGVSYISAVIQDDVNATQGGAVKAGNHVPDVPEWSGKVSAIFNKSLPRIGFLPSPELNARLDYTYVGERPADVQNHYDLDAYHKVDTRIGIAQSGVELYVWGRNLVGDHYDLYGFYDVASATKYGAPAPGRAFGLGFSATF
ncbi:TonB-dependent receptor [Rhodospirillum rubrum F11]|nr:TonB-dependent receptor [Rhodospirillum rubrum F11]